MGGLRFRRQGERRGRERLHRPEGSSEKLAEELISPGAVFHVPGRPEPLRGPAGYLAVIGLMRGAFPDIQWTLEEMIAEDDKVASSGNFQRPTS